MIPHQSGWMITSQPLLQELVNTHLFRAGNNREFIKELGGDSRKDAFDLYNHIDLRGLKEAYLTAIPQMGS